MRHPDTLKQAFAHTARSLGKTFKYVGSLNGSGNAPMPERNKVVHLAAFFLSSRFSVYAEPSLPTGQGRIDLLVSNRRFTCIFEVETFGEQNPAAILHDAKRIVSYSPKACERIDGIKPDAFWKHGVRWGAVLIQSFAGKEFSEVWSAQIKREFRSKLSQSKLKKQVKKDFMKLASFLKSHKAQVGCEPVCKDIWANDTEQLDLLWAVFSL